LIRESGTVTAIVNREKVEIEDLTGRGSFDGSDWKLKNVSGKVFGGKVKVAGTLRDSVLSHGSVTIDGVKLSSLKQVWKVGKAGSASNGLLSIHYEGSLDAARQTMEGEGTLHLENAPVFEVPLLDQTYDLFAALVPGVKRAGSGEFQADFTARSKLINVDRFEAKGGTVTVSAVGTINLNTKRVDGSAKGKLRGLPGLVTSPLSRLLEMDVGGPFDNIRVKPLGPAKLASNAASGTVGAATDTIGEAGKIAGTVLVEGVKLPFKFLGGKGREKDDDEREP
jgi:hypothetical protein